jgi:hypothetical protein
MQMADEPHDSGRESHQKKEKNDLAFPSHFAQRTRSSGAFAGIARMTALESERDVELLLGVACYVSVWSARWRFVPRNGPLLCNHSLEFFEPLTQFGFLSCYLLLPAAKRRRRSARTTKHPHHRLAIQKKSASATAPKIMSGKVRATPISNH